MKKIIALICLSALVIACGPKKTEEKVEDGTGYDDIPTETTATEVQETEVEPDGVYFLFPEDGSTVHSPVLVGFGVRGMEVEPAGEVREGKGHHHVMVDGSYLEEGTVIPSTEMSIHYGQGQLEAQIELSPGKHTLTMQFGNGVHVSLGELWSKTIEITVEEVEDSAAE